ncbi:MAG: tripartite tricarboxylate transporter TctB family protein [Rhizobiales bacterium]|nr:tripartite tricarboxylate transporter TctB family protein [Hyphomicrobiales bacterium]
MRAAELVMALVLGLFSIYLMYLSQVPPLRIDWVPDKGPGSGWLPFWLSAGMLVCCIVIFVRGLLRTTNITRSRAAFMDAYTVRMVGITTLSIFAMLALTHWLGAYVAITLFLLFQVGILGRHSITTTLAVSLLTPVVIFLLFEGGMKILLPKGITEPFFLPLYKIFVY